MSNVKNTKEMLEFIVAVGVAGGKSAEDLKFGIGDLAYCLEALYLALPAFNGVNSIVGELANLDEAGKAECLEVINSFDIPQDKVEESLKLALKIGFDFAELAAKLRK